MKSKFFVIVFIVITLVVSFSAAFGLWPFGRADIEVWLDKIGLPNGAAYVGESEVSFQDGTKPEMLLQEVAIEGDPERIRTAFVDRCKQADLVVPEASSLEWDSSILCAQRFGSADVSLSVTTNCAGIKCRTFLRIELFSR